MFIISSVDTGGPEELLHHSVIQPIRVTPHLHPLHPHQPSRACVYIPTVAAYTDAFLIATTSLWTANTGDDRICRTEPFSSVASILY